ncbi:MAG TPA: response regulator transcription factor [Anaerolineae bacterium]|nr:response regulator transcription factor [Anaerolineae bacterium]
MSTQPHILVIDDEPQILRAMRTILAEKQFRVTTASRGEEGLALAAADPPDVVILDLGLPDIDGIEVCARLREWTQIPIIVLSVRDDEQDKVAALDKGADDYLTKPFGIRELLARIRVALRHLAHVKGSPRTVVTAGAIMIDLTRHSVTRDGVEVKLTATEFNLLAYLAANAGRLLTHESILTHVWGSTVADRTEYLRVFIGQLRKKLEVDPRRPRIILNEPGIGYRFGADDE